MTESLKKFGFPRQSSSIVIIALNGIGNTLATTPLFTNIKKNFPKTHLAVLALPDSCGALMGNPYVDEIISYPGRTSLFSRVAFLLRLRKQKFDVSIYPYPNGNIMSAIIALLIGARWRLNFQYLFWGRWSSCLDTVGIPIDVPKHDIERNLDMLIPLGGKVVSKRMLILVKEEDKKYVDALLESHIASGEILIGMHVGSKEAMRIWPTENFARLVDLLSNHQNVKILIVGTKIEEELVREFSQFRGENVISIINKATIPQTTEAISRCKVFITTDSGPMHMAVAAGTKVIAVYLGPHIMRTAPYGKEHVVYLTNKATQGIDKNNNHHYVESITPELIYGEIKKSLRLK